MAESYGAWGEEASDIIFFITSRLATSTDKPKSLVFNDTYGWLNVHLVRAKTTFIQYIQHTEHRTKHTCTFPCVHVMCVYLSNLIIKIIIIIDIIPHYYHHLSRTYSTHNTHTTYITCTVYREWDRMAREFALTRANPKPSIYFIAHK